MKSKAYLRGYEAFNEGIKRSENPYESKGRPSQDEIDWNRGYTNAKIDECLSESDNYGICMYANKT